MYGYCLRLLTRVMLPKGMCNLSEQCQGMGHGHGRAVSESFTLLAHKHLTDLNSYSKMSLSSSGHSTTFG